MGRKIKIECPCCRDKFILDKDWWENQSTNVSECPLCLSLIMIDIEEANAVDLHTYLKSSYKRFTSGASNKSFVIKEPDMISYISAENWPE